MTALTSRLSPLTLCWSLSQLLSLALPPSSPLNKLVNVLPRSLIAILLLRSAVHPNPGPYSAPKTFLQWNCNGIRGALTGLITYLHDNDVKVACLQETKLTPRAKDPKIPGYALLRKDRPGGVVGGGVAILVHHSIAFTPLDVSFIQHDSNIELLGISATINNAPISIFNVYAPPASACPRGYLPDIGAILGGDFGDCLILGDWNGHHDAWHSSHVDERGEHLTSEIEDSNFCILNEDSPTRIPQGANNTQRPSSPDISLISAHLPPRFRGRSKPNCCPTISLSPSASLKSHHVPS